MHSRAESLLNGWKKHHGTAANYFITGADAVERRSFAEKMIRHLFCADECEKCAHCEKLARGIHPDLITVPKSGKSVGIEQARMLRNAIRHGPYSASHLVVLVPETETMTPEAIHSLLKSVEDASRNTLFIFCAPYREGIPTTLLSRCQQIPLPDATWDEREEKADILAKFRNKSLGDRIAAFEELAESTSLESNLDAMIGALYKDLRKGEHGRVGQLRSVFHAQRRIQMHVNAPLTMTNLAMDWKNV